MTGFGEEEEVLAFSMFLVAACLDLSDIVRCPALGQEAWEARQTGNQMGATVIMGQIPQLRP